MFSGQPFQDTDVSKWLEAASYALRRKNAGLNVDELEAHVNEAIELFEGAQDEDGYLDTKFELDLPAEKRFKGLRWSHELYTMGHFIEAAVAHYEVTGSKRALDIAERVANCIGHNFGDGEGRGTARTGTRKLSLPWLACTRRPGERRWLDLAAWFIRVRGTDPEFFDEQDAAGGPQFYTDLHMPLKYFVQDEPILDKQHAEGHAVRRTWPPPSPRLAVC